VTATDQQPQACPQCGNRNTTVGASGNAMCLDCAHMWDPKNAAANVVPLLAPFAMAPVEQVYDPLDDPIVAGFIPGSDTWGTAEEVARHPSNVPARAVDDQFAAELEAFTAEQRDSARMSLDAHVGGRVVLEGGQEGFIIYVVEGDRIVVQLPDDREELVALEDVVSMFLPPATPDIPDSPDALDALAPDLRAALELARLIIRAGVESVNGTGETITPGLPPSGYLDVPYEMFPVVEQAAALAVAMILELVDADVDAVLLAVGAVREASDEGDPQTEVAHSEPSSSEDF
jgi:hypothetical protein